MQPLRSVTANWQTREQQSSVSMAVRNEATLPASAVTVSTEHCFRHKRPSPYAEGVCGENNVHRWPLKWSKLAGIMAYSLAVINTAIAHLAGALGVRVWLAVAKAADWRWLSEREESPWYPTMRLFRQREWGCWKEVFQGISAEIIARRV